MSCANGGDKVQDLVDSDMYNKNELAGVRVKTCIGPFIACGTQQEAASC